jgi:diguanylate cyclase (GGDEF)-like protein/PAS domain S-box-containing protein
LNSLINDAPMLAAIIDRLYDSVLVTTTDLEPPGPAIVYANAAFCRKTGYTLDELKGNTPRLLQGPGSDRSVLERLRRNLSAGEPFEGETVNYRKGGEPYTVRWNIQRYQDPASGLDYFVSIQRETTQEVKLGRVNARIVENVAEGIIAIDTDGIVMLVNPAAQAILAIPDQGDWVGRHWQSLFDRNAGTTPSGGIVTPIAGVLERGETYHRYRGELVRPDDSRVEVEMSITPMRLSPESDRGCVVIIRDNTDQRRFEQRLWNAANRDALTRAYNRRFGEEIFAREIQRAESENTDLSLIYFDIDHFKATNDELGHDIGDGVLRSLVSIVGQRLRQGDFLIRWGGEEFVVVLPGTSQPMATKVAEALRARVAEADFGEAVGQVTISLGVSAYRTHEGFKSWLRRVDKALYAAKGAGRNQTVSE